MEKEMELAKFLTEKTNEFINKEQVKLYTIVLGSTIYYAELIKFAISKIQGDDDELKDIMKDLEERLMKTFSRVAINQMVSERKQDG